MLYSASRATPQRFAEYLLQPWYRSLLDWEQFRWEGEPTMLRNGKEAYQQVGVRASAALLAGGASDDVDA